MFSVHQAASIFYYMGRDESSNHEPLSIPIRKEEAKKNYYLSTRQGDPLTSQPVWTGALANLVGLLPGSKVERSHLAAMWFGRHPKTDAPLDNRALSYAEQMAAQNLVADAEASLFAARRAMREIRDDLRQSGMSIKSVNRNVGVIHQQRLIDAATSALGKAQKRKNYRTQAHDLTFSAPKSVSIYWAALKTKSHFGTDDDAAEAGRKADRIQAIIMDSAKAVIDEIIEKEHVFTRHRNGSKGPRRYENVKGLAVALVPHFESRPTVKEAIDAKKEWNVPDPQLHVHALMMAMAQDYDDNVAAIWTRYLSANAKSIGAAFRAEMAAGLRAEGLELRESITDSVNSFELAGITDQQIGSFSKRRAIVAAEIAAGSSSQKAVLAQRNAKRDYTSEELLEDWAKRLVHENVDTRSVEAARNHKTQSNRSNTTSLVETAVSELLEMTGAITLREIQRKAYELAQHARPEELNGRSPISWGKQFITNILSHPDIQVGSMADTYGMPVFTSKHLIRREKALYYEKLASLKRPRESDQVASAHADEAIAKAEAFLSDKKRDVLDFKFADFQKALVHSMVCSDASIHIALAPAGCGKTTAALAACRAFEGQGKRFIALAPSNKAAQQLATDLYKDAADGRTPQSLLLQISSGKRKLTKDDVLFVDEASMLDFDTAEKLIEAALAAKGGPARLVLMGDTEQLPSVGRGNFLRRVVESNEMAVRNESEKLITTRVLKTEEEWSKISRQKHDAGKIATALMALGQNAKALEIFNDLGAVHLCSTKEEAIEELIEDAFDSIATQAIDFKGAESGRDSDSAHREIQESLKSMAILASTRADVAALNTLARAKLAQIGYIDQTKLPSVTLGRGKVGSLQICEGERIIFTEATPATMVSNGASLVTKVSKSTCATVRHIERTQKGARLVVALDGDDQTKLATFDVDSFSNMDYAYATTIHKSQGSTVNCSYELFSTFAAKELDYVAKSRYREQHNIYGSKHEYESYQKRASHVTEKTEAMDVGFSDLSVFAPTQQQLDALDRLATKNGKSLDAFKEDVVSARLRHITQGKLIDFGESEDDQRGRKMHYATIETGGRTITYEGINLLESFEESGIRRGDHVGLEAVSPARSSTISCAKWRWHSERTLSQAGLVRSDENLPALAAQAVTDQVANARTVGDSLIGKAALAPENDRVSIAMAQIKQHLQTTAELTQELASMDRNNSIYKGLPRTSTDNAFAWLKHANPGKRAEISKALLNGIENKAGQEIASDIQRDWLAIDGDIAFSMNPVGTVEGWFISELPQSTQAQIRGTCLSLIDVQAHHQDNLAFAQDAAQIVLNMFKDLSKDLSISAVEHDNHGICLAIGAKDFGFIKKSPFLSEAFAPKNGSKSETISAICDLKNHQGYSDDHKGYLFPMQIKNTNELISEGDPVFKELIAYASDMVVAHSRDYKSMIADQGKAERLAKLSQDLNAPSQARLIEDIPSNVKKLDMSVVCCGPAGVLLSEGQNFWVADLNKMRSIFGRNALASNGKKLQVVFSRSKNGTQQINSLLPSQ